MKKIIICTMLLIFSATIFCQQTQPKKVHTREEYLKISKSQKIAGFVFLGFGVITLVTASVADVDFDTLGGLVIAGTITSLISIPLLIGAGRNKRKAKNAALTFKFEKIQMLQQGMIDPYSLPSISVKIHL